MTSDLRRPPRTSLLAAALKLPPDTPDNLAASIGRRRRAINELYRIQKEYEANVAPPAPRASEPPPLAKKGS
jgi:hypothetical protein